LTRIRPLTTCAIFAEASRQAFRRQAKRPSLPSIPEESPSDGTYTINLLTINSNATTSTAPSTSLNVQVQEDQDKSQGRGYGCRRGCGRGYGRRRGCGRRGGRNPNRPHSVFTILVIE
jgi:hypothetical protein